MSNYKWSLQEDKKYQEELIKLGWLRVMMNIERSQMNDDLSDEEYQRNSAWLTRLYLIRDGKIKGKKKKDEGIRQNMMFKKKK